MQNDKANFKNEFKTRLIQYTVKTLHFTDQLREKRNLWAIADQLVRSASSVGANIVEAKSASSRRDYIKFFEISLKSANETKYWLEVLREYDKQLETKELSVEIDEISRIIGSSVLTLKGKR